MVKNMEVAPNQRNLVRLNSALMKMILMIPVGDGKERRKMMPEARRNEKSFEKSFILQSSWL